MGHWLRVLEAMLLLLLARMLVALVPFRYWRATLGPQLPGAAPAVPEFTAAADARVTLLRAALRRALLRLPLNFKCLPRAMALHWMLRRRSIASQLTIASLPSHLRTGTEDELHAWVEAAGAVQVGASDLPYRPLIWLGDPV